jgi:hypothetical protein
VLAGLVFEKNVLMKEKSALRQSDQKNRIGAG